MGKSSVNGPFSRAMLNNQRVIVIADIDLRRRTTPNCSRRTPDFFFDKGHGETVLMRRFHVRIRQPRACLEIVGFADNSGLKNMLKP
jgi:hypothetical protein